MHIRIKECNNFPGVYNYDYMSRLGFGYVTHLRLGNKYCMVLSRSELPKISTVEIIEEMDKPLYKQHMDLMMGRVPNKRVITTTYRAIYITQENITKHRYYIYETVY